MSVPLTNLYGRAQYFSLAADLYLNPYSAKALFINANGHDVYMPLETLFPWTDPCRFLIINGGSSDFWVKYPQVLSHSYYSISASSSDNSFTAASGGLAITPAQSWVDVSGFSNSGNNGTLQVTQRNQDGTKLYVNGSLTTETVNVTPPTPPATTPLPPVTVSRQKIAKISPNECACFMLGLNTVWNIREWYYFKRATGGTHAFTSKRADGSAHSSICVAGATPPPPPPPPPPYDGETISLSTCPGTKTVTLSGGTNQGTIWNGVWTVTLNLSVTPPYYRFVIDNNHWVELRYFPGGQGYGYQWQVICHSLTGRGGARFGNNTAGTCPPNGSYTCFPVPADNARCYAVLPGDSTAPNGPLTCVVSA